MNNKQLGMEFEDEMVEILAKHGYWVHFFSPDKRGSQPFDIIAVKDGFAVAMDCKTCKDKIFRLGRLEENQIMAFEKWLKCGNEEPYIAVKHNEVIHLITYTELKQKGSIELE